MSISNFPLKAGYVVPYLTTYYSTVVNGVTYYHSNSIDVPNSDGFWIVAPTAGTVRFSYSASTGYMASVVDGAGKTHRMMHMREADRQLAWDGKPVAAGTSLGRVGRTGAATGPHLHYDYNLKNSPVPFASKLTWTAPSGPDKDQRTTHSVRSTTGATSTPPGVSQHAGYLVKWADEKPNPVTTWLVGPDLRRTWIPDGGVYNWCKAAGAPGPRNLTAAELNGLPDRYGVHTRTNSLGVGWIAPRGTTLHAKNGYICAFQGDSNLVVYRNGTALWASRTNGRGATKLVMQHDGNLVLYTATGTAVWNSRTDGNGRSRLTMQDDGNLVIYNGAGIAKWHTGTYGGTNRLAYPAGIRL